MIQYQKSLLIALCKQLVTTENRKYLNSSPISNCVVWIVIFGKRSLTKMTTHVGKHFQLFSITVPVTKMKQKSAKKTHESKLLFLAKRWCFVSFMKHRQLLPVVSVIQEPNQYRKFTQKSEGNTTILVPFRIL